MIDTPPGTGSFDGEKVILGPSGPDSQGAASHPLAGVPLTGITYQFQLQEVATPPTGGKQYIAALFDSAGDSLLMVFLKGDGSLFFVVGTVADYAGVWTPSNGGVRQVHAVIDASGIPSLWIDGTSIPLSPTFFFPFTSTPNSIQVSVENSDFDGQGAYDNIFVAIGVFPPSTVFCCT